MTLAANKVRPFLKPIDISGTPLQKISNQYEDFRKWLEVADDENLVKRAPEDDAIWFYMMNHAMSCIAQRLDEFEPLGEFESTVFDYHKMMQVKALRMFYYLLIITTRESRHAKIGPGLTKLYDAYPSIKNWHRNKVQDTSHHTAINAMLKSAPNVSLGEYVNFLYDAFRWCKYGGGFGGAEWAKVTFPLREFVHGRISAEMMLDVAFTLCHNNGPIFNKGMFYTGYNHHEIKKILDVQRGGQIPQLVANTESTCVTPKHKKYQKELEGLIGPEFGGYVCWYTVEALGSLEKYPNQKMNQDSVHGKPPHLEQMEKIAAMKKSAEEKKKQKAQEEFLQTHLEVMSGVYAEKVTIEREYV